VSVARGVERGHGPFAALEQPVYVQEAALPFIR